MKPTVMDRLVSWFSPGAGLRRLRDRAHQELALRAYDAAQTYSSSDWVSAQKTSANAETSAALPILRQKSRDLARNSPYAVRALNVIVSNTVGAGIPAKIVGRSPRQTKQLTELWNKFTETSACDLEGRRNFAALQSLAMRSVVESGEVVSLHYLTPEGPKLKLLESDFIVSELDMGNTVQGIDIDENGKPVAFNLYKKHPGDRTSTSQTFSVLASELAHAFKQDRPGQVRGVPWSHAVIETLKDLADFQNATLIRQKISACLMAFVTGDGSPGTLSSTDLKTKREAEISFAPGSVKYLAAGEDVKFSSPPGTEGYSEFVREGMRAVAAGYGISYEAMTGDYSQVNFSSGRMGHIEFRRNIDSWRWHILIPQFCEPYFQLFLRWCRALGIDVEGVRCEWVPPAHTMIDPTKEITADKEAVKAGFKSRRRVIREQGDDPEVIEREIKEERDAAAQMGLKFDTDVAVIETQQKGISGGQTIQEDAPDKPNSGGDK